MNHQEPDPMKPTNNGTPSISDRNVPYQEAWKLHDALNTLRMVAPLWPSSGRQLDRIREAIGCLITDYQRAGDALDAEPRTRGTTDQQNAEAAQERGWSRGAFDDDCAAIALAPTEHDVMTMVTVVLGEHGIEVEDGETLENLLDGFRGGPGTDEQPFLASLVQAAITRIEELA